MLARVRVPLGRSRELWAVDAVMQLTVGGRRQPLRQGERRCRVGRCVSGGWVAEGAVDEVVELVVGEGAHGVVGGGEVDVFVDEGHVVVE